MAIFRTGAIVGAISGALGGVVFVAGGKSAVVRPRPVTISKDSPALAIARARLQYTRNAWSTMTDLQRAAWNTLALTIPTTNRLGVTSPTNGFHLFVRFNLQRRNTPDTLRFDAPTQGIGQPPQGFNLAFSAAGDFTINAQPPPDFGAAIYFMYGQPFWTNEPTSQPCRVVFLAQFTAPGLTFNLRPFWETRFGTMVEQQRFCAGIAAMTANTFRSEILIIRGKVAD